MLKKYEDKMMTRDKFKTLEEAEEYLIDLIIKILDEKQKEEK